MPPLGLLFAAAALTVKQDGAELRTDCDGAEPAVARLAAGLPATVRFGMNGCYAVVVEQGGKSLTGFLRASQIEGIEEWEASRRSAPPIDAPRDSRRTTPVAVNGNPLQVAQQLILDNRPGEALEIAERGLVQTPRDPQLLALAGIAALRNDMSARAIGYLKDSLAIRHDAVVERALEAAQRENGADRSGEVLHSPRFQLRYDPRVMPAETARALVAVLEQEYSRISFELGCRTAERIAAIAQTREDYMRSTGAAEWSGGQYDGRIRVALLDNDPAGPATRRAFAHEVVHACLAATGNWPAWLHEGLAQKLSGETLSEAKRSAILAAAKANQLPRLGNLSQSWSRMSGGHAALAYATALLAVELFYQHHQAFGIRNLLRGPEHLDRIAADLDQRLRQ